MTTVDDHLAIGDFQTLVRHDDAVVRDHRVHGVPVLPGVAYLDAVLRAAVLSGHDPGRLELRNILFEAPVALAGGRDQRLVFRSHEQDGGVRVRIGARPADADADMEADGPGEDARAECLVHTVTGGRPPARLDVEGVRRAIAAGQGTPVDGLYETIRRLGIEHGPFMRAGGVVVERGDRLVAELSLGDEARARHDDFFLPPTFLDAAVVVPMASVLADAGTVFLPVFVSRFRAWTRAGDTIYVETGPGVAVRRGDVVEADLRLYGADGRLIAEIERLTAMRARPDISGPGGRGAGATAEATVAPAATATRAPAEPEPVAGVRPATVGVRPRRRLDVAVVGMSGRYPGADDLDAFWRNLEAGHDAVGEVPGDRWDAAPYQSGGQTLSRYGAFLADVDKFDALFFRVPPSVAPALDPQERLFLETAYAAVENAGYTPDALASGQARIGVFVGATWTDYRLIGAEASRSGPSPTVVSALSSIANRVSYAFDFDGPSMTVDTACSSSLTALHLACRSIADGECDGAIVGGVNLLLHPDKYLLYRQLGMMASDGRCRAFGAGGDGYVPGEGVGALFLRPVGAAEAAGDTVHGVIRATAVNHGGRAAGFTVPKPGAQAEAVRRALDESGVEPDTIGYVEAHGTGTALGDPIEAAGLSRAFAGRTRPLAVGSVKTNIGHLEAAAGIAAVSRALLQLRHGRITPSLHSEVLNPEIDFDASPLYVPQVAEDWARPVVDGVEQPRRTGVSSFGAGGANAHVILEEHVEPPRRAAPAVPAGPEIVVLSARSTDRLRAYAERLARHLRTVASAEPGRGAPDFADMARTLQVGRPALDERLAFVAATAAEAADHLDRFATGHPTASAPAADAAGPAGDAGADLAERYHAGDLAAVARLWAAGASADWMVLNGGPRRRVPLPGYPFERRRFWIDRPAATPATPASPAANASPEPSEGIVTTTHLAPTPSLASGTGFVGEVRRAFEAELTAVPDQLERADGAMGRYAAVAVRRRLAEMGLRAGPATVPELARQIDLVPTFDRFFGACLAVLDRHGVVRREGEVVHVLPEDDEPERLRADLVARFPEAGPFVHLLQVCLDAYPETLRGRRPATEVLFAGSSLDLMAGIYRGNRVYDHYSALAARFVAHAVAIRARTGRPVRVLEVGAGTGGTSHAALAALAAGGHDVEYHYTDLGGSFVAHGRRTFGPSYPFARFQVVDMEKDPESQGFAPASVDVVLAVGALHAVADIDETLARVHRVLAPSGLLVLGEAVENHDLLAVTIGLLDGWHLYRDPDKRLPHAPLLSEEGWRAAFARTGFDGFAAYGPGLTGDPDPSHRLLVAARPAGLAVPAPVPPAPTSAPEPAPGPGAPDGLEPVITAIVADGLGVGPDEIRPDRSFAEYGVDSILAVKIVDQVNGRFGLELKPTVLFDHPSVRALTDLAESEGATVAPAPEPPAAEPPATESTPAPAPAPIAAAVGGSESGPRQALDIAVIGMAGRYPGARDYRELWHNLVSGHDAITEVPPERWDIDAFYQPWPPAPGKTYSRWGGYLPDIDRFDPLFFGITPAEADFMDPQQRLFLEEAWTALEDAGLDAHRLRRSRCGVFVGAPPSDYTSLIRERGHFGHQDMFTGNSPAILPARIAYHLDLTGPCFGVDTACSSSLVALHQACRSLAADDCDLALAGGVAVFATPEHHQLTAAVGMLSPTGRCRAFDAAGDGIVMSEGVGVVVLKPLDRALADGDPIHGVIKGIGVNQDGRTNGITAPSARSQAELETGVYERFGIDPSTIGYVEAHGTGTKLGDPIEVEALATAFGRSSAATGTAGTAGSVPIGSIKSNIGHTSHAAGVAGLIKVLLAMRERSIPPTLHVETPNPIIGFDDTPFVVNTELRRWDGGPRRAALSSFGFSGTNAHVVVEEHEDRRPPTTGRTSRALVPLSAATEDSLRRAAAALAHFLGDRPDVALHDVAATLQVGRAVFAHRLAVVAGSVGELRALLVQAAAGQDPDGVFAGAAEPDARAGSAVRLAPDADLAATAAAWVAGSAFDFAALHAGGTARRLHLPGYAFARDRCWVPDPTPAPAAGPAPTPAEVEVEVDGPPVVVVDLEEQAERYLKDLLAREARLPVERLRSRAPLQDYGIESVLIAKLNRRLADDFGELPSTLFFEHQTIAELAGYFAAQHADRLVVLTTPTPTPPPPRPRPRRRRAPLPRPPPRVPRRRPRPATRAVGPRAGRGRRTWR